MAKHREKKATNYRADDSSSAGRVSGFPDKASDIPNQTKN